MLSHQMLQLQYLEINAITLSQSELDSAVFLYDVLQIRDGDLTIAYFMLSEIK